MDYKNLSSYIGLGAAIENLVLKSHSLSQEVKIDLFPIKDQPSLVAAIYFLDPTSTSGKEMHHSDQLVHYIETRCTNRIITGKQPIEKQVLDQLKQVVKTTDNATLHLIEKEEELNGIAELVGRAERIRLLNPRSHYDFFFNELRWNTEQAELTNDGVDLSTMELSANEVSGLHIAKDPKVMSLLNKWNKGDGLRRIRRKAVKASSAVGLITIASNDHTAYIEGGRLMERLWLTAQQHGVAFQPLYVPLTLFDRLADQDTELGQELINEVKKMRSEFISYFPIDKHHREIMLFRLCIANAPNARSLRRPVKEVLYFQ